MAEKNRLVIIAGPTASGKSIIGLRLAKELGGEIINADSVQVYKFFDIGSAKPTIEERVLVPHHLIDIALPDEDFNAYKFKELARAKVREIFQRGNVPIVVGGTGLYIRTFLYDLFNQDEDKIKREREKILEEIKTRGLDLLYEELKLVDSKSAKKIHPNDYIRISRALEYYRAYKKPISEVQEDFTKKESFCEFKIFIPQWDKSALLERIRERTIKIFKNGIIDEVKRILSLGYSKDIKPFKSIGYKEALKVIEGQITLEEAINETIKETKDYAKRQIVWFKKERNVEFVDCVDDNFGKIIDEIKKFLK